MKDLLAKYCGKNPANIHRIGTPWSAGDYTYATNEHIIIRVARVVGVPENTSAPDMVKRSEVSGVFDNEPAEWVSVPPVDYVREDCPICDGTITAHLCPECEGVGEVAVKTRFSAYLCPCKTCDGRGQIPKKAWDAIVKTKRSKGKPVMETCGECNFTGFSWTPDSRKIGGVKINMVYLSMIGGLPGAEIGVFGPRGPARFRFDGGEGLVMPMNPDEVSE